MSAIYELARNIHRDEFDGDDTIVSYRVVSGWLANNLGDLNTLLNTSFSGDDAELDLEAQAIYADLYMAHYYHKQARNALRGVLNSTSSGSNILSIRDGESAVSFVNSKEVGKEFRSLATSYKERALRLSHQYNMHQSVPRQVAGTDGDWLSGTY